MSDFAKWSVPAMQAGVDDIDRSKKHLSGIHSDLNSNLAPMREFWQGSGNESYEAVQKRWNTAMENMMDVLNRIEVALQRAMEIHGEGESRITQSWQQ